MGYIRFDVSLSNQIDLNELEKVKEELPNKFKNLKFIVKYNHLLDMKLEDYYVEDEYDDVKALAIKLSRVLLKGEISIILDGSEDDYMFTIEPNTVKFFIKEVKWLKINEIKTQA